MICDGCKKITKYGGYFQLFGWLCKDCKKKIYSLQKLTNALRRLYFIITKRDDNKYGNF